MSHHIISGRNASGRAEPIKSEINALKIYQDFPTIDIKHIVDSVSIGSGSTHTTSPIKFSKRTKILIFGTSSQNNVSINLEISPELDSPINFFETYENVSVQTGTIYSFVNLYTDYFRIKIINNESSSTIVNLYATSKN